MRRVLVVSDSHDDNDNVRKAIKKAGKIDLMIHLGDVGRDYLEVERMSVRLFLNKLPRVIAPSLSKQQGTTEPSTSMPKWSRIP